MDKNIKERLATTLENIANFILTGNRNREKVIKNLNTAFQSEFVSEYFQNLCIADVVPGAPKFRNEYSHPSLKTGLRITIINDRNLTKEEIIKYAMFFGESERFVRGFMVLGFDTLILHPKTNFNGKGIKALQIGLKSFFNANRRKIR